VAQQSKSVELLCKDDPLVAQAATYTTHNENPYPQRIQTGYHSNLGLRWPPRSAQFCLLMLDNRMEVFRRSVMFFVIIELLLPDGNEYSYAKAFHILDLRTLRGRRNPFDEVLVMSILKADSHSMPCPCRSLAMPCR